MVLLSGGSSCLHAFAFMDYNNKKLNIHLKTNFNKSKMRKNIENQFKNTKKVLALCVNATCVLAFVCTSLSKFKDFC